MKPKKQAYWLVLHARPTASVSVEEKHHRFFSGISEIPEPWGRGDKPLPPIPSFNGGVSASLSLTKFFGPGVRRAMLTFRYRGSLSDDGLCDDLLNIVIDPSKFDTHHLLYEVVPVFIEAFDSYLVEYFDDRMIEVSASQLRGKPINPRRYVYRIGLASYFDQELCQRAFNLTPPQIQEKVEAKAEHVQLLHGGVYIVGKSTPLPVEEAQIACAELMNAVAG